VGTTWASDPLARMLVRHQWVRDHGTPRVSVLLGPPAAGAARWRHFTTLVGRREEDAPLWRAPRAADVAWLREAANAATASAERIPARPVALACTAALMREFVGARRDRGAAMLREGFLEVPEARGQGRVGLTSRATRAGAARSLAELALFEALEATPSTRGRFRLNEPLPQRFGTVAVEVDLLARAEAIAIEVDGYHHFRDVEAYRRDRRKDALLQARGLCVLRFLADDVLTDSRTAVRAVLEVLARRPREKGRR